MKLHEVNEPMVKWQDHIDNDGNIDVSSMRPPVQTLTGCPSHVNNFMCRENMLTTLQNGPQLVDGDFDVAYNLIKSIDFAPEFIAHNFCIQFNDLTNLHNIHKYVKYIGIKFSAYNNPLKSHVLGLCLIEGLQEVRLGNPYKRVDLIFNTIFAQTRDRSERLLLIQDKLIDAGFEKMAQL